MSACSWTMSAGYRCWAVSHEYWVLTTKWVLSIDWVLGPEYWVLSTGSWTLSTEHRASKIKCIECWVLCTWELITECRAALSIECWVLSIEYWILSTESWALSAEYWVLMIDDQHWVLITEGWALSHEYSVLNAQYEAYWVLSLWLSTRSWVFGTKHWISNT